MIFLLLQAAKAKLKVFDDQLAHLLGESSLRGQLLEDLSEDGRVSHVIISSEHE